MRPCCRLRCRIPVRIEVRGRRDGSGDCLATMVVRRGAQASAGAQDACTPLRSRGRRIPRRSKSSSRLRLPRGRGDDEQRFRLTVKARPVRAAGPDEAKSLASWPHGPPRTFKSLPTPRVLTRRQRVRLGPTCGDCCSIVGAGARPSPTRRRHHVRVVAGQHVRVVAGHHVRLVIATTFDSSLPPRPSRCSPPHPSRGPPPVPTCRGHHVRVVTRHHVRVVARNRVRVVARHHVRLVVVATSESSLPPRKSRRWPPWRCHRSPLCQYPSRRSPPRPSRCSLPCLNCRRRHVRAVTCRLHRRGRRRYQRSHHPLDTVHFVLPFAHAEQTCQ